MQDSQPKQPVPGSRRRFFAGAATVGAVAAVVTTLPRIASSPVAAEAVPTLPPAPDNGGGYSLSEHVKRYYKSASA